MRQLALALLGLSISACSTLFKAAEVAAPPQVAPAVAVVAAIAAGPSDGERADKAEADLKVCKADALDGEYRALHMYDSGKSTGRHEMYAVFQRYIFERCLQTGCDFSMPEYHQLSGLADLKAATEPTQ